MDLTKIVTISGIAGLHRIIGQTKNGVIVASLEDGKRFPAYASQRLSTLADISVFFKTEDKPLRDILKTLFEKQEAKKLPSMKEEDELKKFFSDVFPEYDNNRVYTSDIKKVIHWYNALLKADLLKPLEEIKTDGEEKTEIVSTENQAIESDKLLKKAKVATQNITTHDSISIKQTSTKGAITKMRPSKKKAG